MKVRINATSNMRMNSEYTIIRVESIDEAIHKLQTDRDLMESVVDARYTQLGKLEIPTSFVIDVDENYEYDAYIEIYDTYRE